MGSLLHSIKFLSQGNNTSNITDGILIYTRVNVFRVLLKK